MKNDTPLYPYGIQDAKERNELQDWWISFGTNVECRDAIEEAIHRDFDGTHLSRGCAESVIEQYGYRRTAFVLANTLQELEHDGRLSRRNKAWGRKIYVSRDPEHNSHFAVNSHPAVLDGFIDEFRAAVHALGLFDRSHCVECSDREDYTGQILVMKPGSLKEKYWAPQNQLWYALDGFGCSPTAVGRAVRATCLGDGETARWARSDFAGILKPELLPAWAEEKLSEIKAEETQTQDGPSMQGPISI